MYYFIGIKGSGMASLARILYDLGYEVAGSDIDKYIFLEDGLRERNIPIYSLDRSNAFPTITSIPSLMLSLLNE